MKVVLQRVKRASVTGNLNKLNSSGLFLCLSKVNSEIVGSIDAGLCLLVGLTHEDTEKDLNTM